MGYGNVSISLALARAQLAQQGITEPTPAQLQTALLGGSITANGTTVTYRGILQMRADGMGWGEIAHSFGARLGPIVSGIHTQNAHLSALPAAVPMSTNTSLNGGNGIQRDHSLVVGKSRGIVTAGGSETSGADYRHGKGSSQASGAGIVESGAPRGQGIVTAAGQGASPVAQGLGQGKAAIVTEGGGVGASNNGGNGRALGHSK